MEVLIGKCGTIFCLSYVHCGESCLATVCEAKHSHDVHLPAFVVNTRKAVTVKIEVSRQIRLTTNGSENDTGAHTIASGSGFGPRSTS